MAIILNPNVQVFFEKGKGLHCDNIENLFNNYRGGWYAVGTHTDLVPIHTGTTTNPGLEDLYPAYYFLSSHRHHEWSYIGLTEVDRRYFIYTYTESTTGLTREYYAYRYYDPPIDESWTHESIIWCGCDPNHEHECGDCCIHCCNTAEKILTKFGVNKI